ncbi:MAG TPA: hypothetical protein VGA71_15305, partial [Actinomycetota bacterium]
MSGLLPDGRIALASILAGVTAAAAAGLIVRPTPRLASRVRPYTLIPRSRLGRSADIPDLAGEEAWLSGSTFRRLFGPPVLALAGWLGGLLDARSDQGLRLMLRQAGYRDLSPEEYRVRQLLDHHPRPPGDDALGGLDRAPSRLDVHGQELVDRVELDPQPLPPQGGAPVEPTAPAGGP